MSYRTRTSGSGAAPTSSCTAVQAGSGKRCSQTTTSLATTGEWVSWRLLISSCGCTAADQRGLAHLHLTEIGVRDAVTTDGLCGQQDGDADPVGVRPRRPAAGHW